MCAIKVRQHALDKRGYSIFDLKLTKLYRGKVVVFQEISGFPDCV